MRVPHMLLFAFLVLVGASALLQRLCAGSAGAVHAPAHAGPPRSRAAVLKSAASSAYAKLASSVNSTVSWRKRVYPEAQGPVVFAELIPVAPLRGGHKAGSASPHAEQ